MSLSDNTPSSSSQVLFQQSQQQQQQQRVTRQNQGHAPAHGQENIPATRESSTSTRSRYNGTPASASETATAYPHSTTAATGTATAAVGIIPPTPPHRARLPPIRIPELDPRVFGNYQFSHPHQQPLSSPLPLGAGTGIGTSGQASADPYTGTRHLPHPLSSPGGLYPGTTQYFHPHSHQISASTSSSPLSIDSRVLRSPHPPLTALINPAERQAYHSQYLQQQQQQHQLQLQQQALLLPPPDQQRRGSSAQISLSSHRPYHTISPLFDHPSSSPGIAHTTAPPYLPPISSQLRTSPVQVPPPLRFNYSATPPDALSHYHDYRPSSAQSHISSHSQTRAQNFPQFLVPAMPPRRQPVADTVTMSGTPATISSATSSSRPRKGAKGNGWTMEHTYDSVGQKKEVIVIDDSQTPEHPPRKRTRAQVAAENAAAQHTSDPRGYPGTTLPQRYGNGHLTNGSTAHSVASTSSAGKKRKVDESDKVAPKKGKAAPTTAAQPKGPQVLPVPANQTNTWDDAEGHYIVRPDDIIGSKYKIVRLLGQGTFGKVVEARNVENRRKVAIKVIRAVQKYRDASKIEIRVLETLRRHDPTNSYHCIHLDEYFDHRNHPCIVSELYGMSVFDFLKQNSFAPFPERHIQDFARSLLNSVSFLHKLKLVHTDLKPENILLVSNEARLAGPRKAGAKSRAILKNTDIRLIDFGSATFENEYHSSVVSTRHYRAPEIILGLPWSYPCDMFSIGCILVEFFTGDALFQTHDNLEHLAMMEVVMGAMPVRMINKSRVKKPEFFKNGKIDFPNPTVSRSSRKYVKTMRSLVQIIPPTSSHNKMFLDLIERLLDFDPETRCNVQTALNHPYLKVATAEPPTAADTA